MRVIDLIIVGVTLGILWGSWQFLFLYMSKISYSKLKFDNERFLDFCIRNYNSAVWIIRKKLHIDWFYNSKAFRIFTILKGVLLVGMSILVIVLVFCLKNTDYYRLLFERI